jgi:aminopeptidase N
MIISKVRRGHVKIDHVHSIKPLNYDLSLFNLEFGGGWTYDGLVKINSKVKSDTQELVINTKELEITKVNVLGKDGSCKWKTYDHTNGC